MRVAKQRLTDRKRAMELDRCYFPCLFLTQLFDRITEMMFSCILEYRHTWQTGMNIKLAQAGSEGRENAQGAYRCFSS